MKYFFTASVAVFLFYACTMFSRPNHDRLRAAAGRESRDWFTAMSKDFSSVRCIGLKSNWLESPSRTSNWRRATPPSSTSTEV